MQERFVDDWDSLTTPILDCPGFTDELLDNFSDPLTSYQELRVSSSAILQLIIIFTTTHG